MTNESAECLAKVGAEMRVELSRCEIRRPPFYSMGVVCLSVEAFIGVLCEAIRSANGKPLQNELVELGKNLMWEPEGDQFLFY
jgi:hypothetical protein